MVVLFAINKILKKYKKNTNQYCHSINYTYLYKKLLEMIEKRQIIAKAKKDLRKLAKLRIADSEFLRNYIKFNYPSVLNNLDSYIDELVFNK